MQPSRIYLIGFMGAGKTTVGLRLAKQLGWKFIDLDKLIEREEGRAIAGIFRENGEPHFRSLERRYLHKVSKTECAVIALGGGTYVDPANRELADKTGVTVWLKVSFTKAADRVKIDGTRPKFRDREQAEQLYRSREPFYELAKVHISTDEQSPVAVAEEILGVIRKS